MVGIEQSCDPERLKKVLVRARIQMRGYYGLTEEDKEDILVDMMYRFEVDKGRFPLSVYDRHCHNKIVGFLAKKTAQKRMAQKVVDGTRVFFPDVSLNIKIGDEDSDDTLENFIPAEEDSFAEVELLSDVERLTPDLVPLVRRVLSGDVLTSAERKALRQRLSTGVVGPRSIRI